MRCGAGQTTCSQGLTCSVFVPTVTYQQGVLSATILYEILLGKATVYAVLVSTLVLMAMVRRRVGWGRHVTGNLTTQTRKHRYRDPQDHLPW